jgi:hypothetical protein
MHTSEAMQLDFGQKSQPGAMLEIPSWCISLGRMTRKSGTHDLKYPPRLPIHPSSALGWRQLGTVINV